MMNRGNRGEIDTDRFSLALRSRGIDLAEAKVLVTSFAGSEQESDLSKPPNCKGVGRLHRFFRSQGAGWPENPIPIDPASRWLGDPYPDSVDAQVFQNAICNWRCWYCYVDYSLLSADPKHSRWMTTSQLIDLYQTEEPRLHIVDLSGGQPDLVPEWVLWFADGLSDRGLAPTTYLWSDDNLSNDYLWRYLDVSAVSRLAAYKNYGRVGCFKGFDERSFGFNTGAAPELFDRQFELMKRIVDFGFDVYGYATFTGIDKEGTEQGVKDFIDKLQERIHPNFPLRTVPLRILEFTPMRHRAVSVTKVFEVQEIAVNTWMHELRKRYSSTTLKLRIFEHSLDNRA
jgi:uncharacterized Fe-S cluster-containing radical SAM superfamily protein